MQVVTSSEGEPQFKFDQWIQENGLSNIKQIFERHGAVTPDKLTLTSKEFNAGVMVDPELFTKNAALIPQMMQAMHTVAKYADDHSTKPQSKQRVVITEVEEIAMDKAAKECEKIMEDVLKFEEMIRNTNANDEETQRQITEKFKEIANMLKEREKQLMTELEEVRWAKTDLFEKQVIVLKGFNKKYNDLNHQWDELLDAADIDRCERKKKIVEESDGLVAQAQNLQKENKTMFDRIGDQIVVHFGEFQQFVDEFGVILSGDALAPPIVTAETIESNSATFVVTTSSGAMDDEKEDRQDVVYQVEWKNQDSDEKAEWTMKEFNSADITIDGLSKGKQYQVRCKMRIASNVYSKMSDPLPFTTLNLKNFEVRRSESIGGNWNYKGTSDALSFRSNLDIWFQGIGVFDCKGTVSAQYKVYEGDNRNGIVIAESVKSSWTKTFQSNTPIRFDLPAPVKLKKNTLYTLDLVQKNNGSGSYHADAPKSTVTVDNVIITFQKASKSPNGTSTTIGAFPVLSFAV